MSSDVGLSRMSLESWPPIYQFGMIQSLISSHRLLSRVWDLRLAFHCRFMVLDLLNMTTGLGYDYW
jgi:hypothetical protein